MIKIKSFHVTSKTIFRVCSHGSGGPRLGELARLGRVTNLSIQSLSFSRLCSHERSGTSPRWVTRSARPGNPLRWGQFSPCECWSWGAPPNRGYAHSGIMIMFSLNIRNSHPSTPGLLILHVKARLFYYGKAGYFTYPGSPTSMWTGP